MFDIQTAFDFDEEDLKDNRHHQLSYRQMEAIENQIHYHARDGFLQRYNYMLKTFVVGAIPLAGVIAYAIVNQQQWLAYVMIFVIGVALIASFGLAILDDEKPRRKSKFKKYFHHVNRIQGRVRRETVRSSDGLMRFEIHINPDRIFTVTYEQWQSLDEQTEYIFYYANNRILSLEPVRTGALMPHRIVK